MESDDRPRNFCSKGTPPEIVAKLADTVREALSDPAVRERLASIGFETKWIGPVDFGKHVRDDMELWATATKEVGIERQ